MSVVADTSFLYALYNEEDPHHRRAKQSLRSGEPVYVPIPVVTETISLIHYRMGFAAAERVLKHLLALPVARIHDGAPLPAVAASFEAASGTLSFVDAVVVETCHALAARPLTYDKALRDAAG